MAHGQSFLFFMLLPVSYISFSTLHSNVLNVPRLKDAKEGLKAEKKEEIKQRIEKEKEDKKKEREIKKEEKRLKLEYIKDWKRMRDDLDCDDHKVCE